MSLDTEAPTEEERTNAPELLRRVVPGSAGTLGERDSFVWVGTDETGLEPLEVR